MVTVTVKGRSINVPTIRDSASRRAQQYANNILKLFRTVGLTEDDVNVPLERLAIKNLPASASWWIQDQPCTYEYAGCTKYVENLFVVYKLIEIELAAVESGEKTIEDFVREFIEDKDVVQQRIDARELLGVAADERDLDIISKAYKKLAKTHHPDMHGGDDTEFKAINHAHKVLKKELH